MKRIFFVLTAIMCFAVGAVAQTYCYKKIERVDDNGVRSRVNSSSYTYVTFVNNKARCYTSDANGYSKGGPVMEYRRSGNGVHEYEIEDTEVGRLTNAMMGGETWRFNSDFTRMNQRTGSIHCTFVYELVNGNSSNELQMY